MGVRLRDSEVVTANCEGAKLTFSGHYPGNVGREWKQKAGSGATSARTHSTRQRRRL